MKEFARLIGILTLICLTAGVLLAWANDLTRDPIAAAENNKKLNAVRKVLPPCDGLDTNRIVTVTDDGVAWTFYPVARNGVYAGAAFETGSSKGYGGDVRIMVGVNADGNVQGIEILSHKETPGLGAKISGTEFRNRIAGRNMKTTEWKVDKDGGDIEHITAATISSRAVVGAVAKGIKVYIAHEDEIRSAVSDPVNRTGIQETVQ